MMGAFNEGVLMKELFPGHFKESEKDLREVWDNCVFVFDANILLNLYRYSDTTRKEFLRILNKIKGRTWLPHRAAEEYLSNRLIVIDQQEKSYDDTIKSINSLKSDLENARQHPFVSPKTMKQVERVFDTLCSELSKNKGSHTKRISNDEIKNSISSIFAGNVGSPYEKEKLEELIVDGEERYKQKIPPGFKDGGKSGSSEVFTEKCRKYGDLIVWYQVIEKSIDSKKPIVLVTDDKKEDWWERFKGKTIGPRPELVKEFKDKTDNTFHMYQADRFLELARENLDEAVSSEILEEIREVRRRDRIAHRKNIEMEYMLKRQSEIEKLVHESKKIKEQIVSYDHERHMLKEQMMMLKQQRNDISSHRESLSHHGESDNDIESIMRHISMLDVEQENLNKKLEDISIRNHEKQHHLKMLESKLAHQVEMIEQENAADSQAIR